MAGKTTEGDRLRRHNEEFRYAMAHGITILAARTKLAQLRMAELEERVHPPLKPASEALCGTEAPAIGRGAAESARRFWWQDDRL